MEETPQYSLHTEPQLLQLAAQGDRDAYARLYQHYLPKLYKYLYEIIRSRQDTEEILHDIFLKLWEKRADLEQVRSFNSFVFRIARNRLMNLYDHQKVTRKAIDYISKNTANESGTADERLIYNQYQKVVDAAINAMPPKRRQVYEMSIQQELSYDEIADLLGISKSMVKKQVYAAKDHIREYLQLHAGITTVIVAAAGAVASGVIK